MAENTEDDVGAEGEGAAPAQKSGLVPGLLKWIAIGLGAVILIVTIVVVTVTIMGGSNKQVPLQAVESELGSQKEVLDWYQSLGVIRTKTSDVNPASVVVEVVLGYKKDEKTTSTEITQRTVELKDYLRRFFTSKTADELNPENEEKLKIELRNSINDSILSSSKIKDVRFMQLDVVKQQQ
jgi:flagellar FliL protein